MIDYERQTNGRLKMTVEGNYRTQSGGNMTIQGQTERTSESPYGVVTYKHDTRKFTDFVADLNDVKVIQFAAPFNNVEKSISSGPNIIGSVFSSVYDKVGLFQRIFPSETGMLMRSGNLSSLLIDQTNFKSTVQQPIDFHDSKKAAIKTQAQAQYHQNKDSSFPSIILHDPSTLQHAKLTEGIYSDSIQDSIKEQFKSLSINKPVPTGKAQFTGAMFTDTAVGGLSLTGSGGLIGTYEDYSIGFENPTIVNWFKEFSSGGLSKDHFVKEDKVNAPGVKVTGNLSIYEERNKQLSDLVEILKVVNPDGKQKGLANVVIASPSMDWNEFSRDAGSRDQKQKKEVGKYIKLMQDVTKYGGNGVLIMDPTRVNIPDNQRRQLLKQWHIGSSKYGKHIHTNTQSIQLAEQSNLTEEQQTILKSKGLLKKAQTGIHTLNAGNFRPSGNYSINIEVVIDLLKTDPATAEGAGWIENQIAVTHNAFLPRRDIAREGIAGSMLREFYTPTFKDSQKAGFTQEGLIPNMPLSMPNSFFRYFKPGTRTHIYSDRYRALTGDYAQGIQGDVLRNLDAKLSDPGPGYRLNHLLQQRDLYEPGKGLIGTAAAAVGRFIDTATGFYTMQTIQARESGQLRGSLRKLYESRQRDPYEETENRGFFENLFVKTTGTIGATTTAMAAYFGVTHAYTMARAQVEQVGVDYVLESIAKGKTEGVKGLFISQLLDPSHQELVIGASHLYNADSSTRHIIRNTGEALEAYFDLSTKASLTALDGKHGITTDLINSIVPTDLTTGTIVAERLGSEGNTVVNRVMAEAESALDPSNSQSSLSFTMTRRLDQKLAAMDPTQINESSIRGLITEIYKDLGVDRAEGTIELGRSTDNSTITRVTQPAGFGNLAGVRRLDTSNLQHMFIPLLDEMVLNKDAKTYKTAKENLLRLSKASPVLKYKQTANNIAASSELKIYNYGYERMRQLAEVFDNIATHLPANPIMWIKPIRQAFMGSPTTAATSKHTIEQGDVNISSHTFKELIGPGFTGLINLQGQITRELGQSFRIGIGEQLSINFDLMKRSRMIHTDATELSILITKSDGIKELLDGADEGKFSRFISNQTEYEGLLSKHRKDYEQMLTADDSGSAYAGLRKAMLGIGTVMIVDKLFDSFVLRPQGVDFFDSVMSDVFGSRSPAVEGYEEDSRWQELYGTEYSSALPSIVKYPAAAAGFFIGGHLIPSYEIRESALYKTARDKFTQEGIDQLSAYRTTIQEGTEAATKVGLKSTIVKTKFGTGGALLGASAALIGSQLAINFAAATAKTIVRSVDHVGSVGRWRDTESGLDIDPVKGTASAALANIVQYSIQRQAVNYGQGNIVSAKEKADVHILNMASQGLIQSTSKPSQMFYPFATQIASPFFQFASVAKVDPGKNVISLDAGLQLFPLLGSGLMMPSPITPKVQYTAPLSNRMISNYLRQYQEGFVVPGEPSTMEQEQEIEAFVNMQNISKASSMLLGGGVNLSFDAKPLVYLAMMGAGSDFAKRGMEKYLAFKEVQEAIAPDKQRGLYKELRHYETLFHLGKVSFDTLDKVSRAAYSLSAIMPNYLAKAGTAMLGGSGSSMHRLGNASRKVAPYMLAFGLLGASFRFNDKALESELPNYSELQKLFKDKKYEGLTQEMLRADAANLAQVFVGTLALGTAIGTTGAFESVRSFKGTYDLVESLNESGGQTTYIQRQQHKLFSIWKEHLAEQQEINFPILQADGKFAELEKVDISTPDKALAIYDKVDDNISKGNQLYRRHLNDAARQIDLPLIRTMPTRLGMVSRRVAPIMVGALITAQLLATTDGFKDSPWMSLLKNITSTGSAEYSEEQRALLTRLGINQSRYQPKNTAEALNNTRDYLFSAAFLPFSGNTFGVYQDNPNPFSPLLGPLGVSMGSADEARIYSQSQSVAADISGSLYLMPAMTDGLGEAMNIGPLLSYAKKLEGRPGAASLARALIRGAGLRTKAAKYKGGPTQRDMQAASSPEMQMALTRRYDRLRNLTWQTAGEHMMDIVGEFQQAGRVISDYRDDKIDGINIGTTRPADVMIFDTLGKMNILPILSDGRLIKPKKTTERDLLKFIRNMTAQGAGFGEDVRLEASEDPSDILYSRSQDKGGLPVLSYFSGLFKYAFNSFYDKDQDTLIAGSGNIVGAGLMAGAALVLGASFIGTTASTVIQLAGSFAALSDYGTLNDAKTNVGDLKRSLKSKLRRSSFAIYDSAESAVDGNQRIIRPAGKNYGRVLTINSNISEDVLNQINQNLTGNVAFGSYSAGNALEEIATKQFGDTASSLVEAMSTKLDNKPIESIVVEQISSLNEQLDQYLTVNVDGKKLSISQVFNPSLEEGIQGISDGASLRIAEVLASGKNQQIQRYEIEHILLDEFHRNLETITAEKSFDSQVQLTGQYQSAQTQFGKTQKAAEQAAQAKAAGAVNEAVELYDPSIGYLRTKIQQKGYTGLIAEGAGGALRGAGELINLKAYYEILSYTAAMGTTNEFERRRASQAAAQNTIQAFGLIIPMQAAIGLIQKSPTLTIGAAVGAGIVGTAALQNKQFGKALGQFFNPIFSGLDKYGYRPAVQGLAGAYESLARYTPIPQLLSPIASVFDPIFSGIRRSVSDDPALSMLANFFVPEGVEDFYQRNSMQKTRMTPWGDSQEYYSTKEVGQFYESKMKSRRRRGRVASAGIDDDLLHPFLLGRSADIQSLSLFEDRYLKGDGRIMEQFRPERMMSNTLMLAVQRRQGMIDQHVEGAYLRRPYYKDNVHQDFAVLNALGQYSYAQTGSIFEAPVNQMARGFGPLMSAYGRFAEAFAPYAPITKRSLTGAALGYMAGVQFSHFGRNEEERRRYAAIGGGIGAGIGGVGTAVATPYIGNKVEQVLLRLRKNPLLKSIAEGIVNIGSAIGTGVKALAGNVGKGINAAFPYIGFGSLVSAAVYSNYDYAVNWIDGEDPAKKHPLYNPWLRFGVSTGIGAATTTLGFLGTRTSKTASLYPLAKGIGKSVSLVGKLGGEAAQLGALTYLTNFLLTNNLTGALPRGVLRTVYNRFGLGRPEDFDSMYDTTSGLIAVGVGIGAPHLARTKHEDYINYLRKTLSYEDVPANSNVRLEQMAQATSEASETKQLLAKLKGSGAIVAAAPDDQVQLLLKNSAGLSDDLVDNLTGIRRKVTQQLIDEELSPGDPSFNNQVTQRIGALINKGIKAKEARLSLVNELIDAQVQRGFIHNTIRSTRGILKVFGNVSTLGVGYATRGAAKAFNTPSLTPVPIAGAVAGLITQSALSNDTENSSLLSQVLSGFAGAYVSLTALGMISSIGDTESKKPLPKVLQNIRNWFIKVGDPNLPEKPGDRALSKFFGKRFEKLGNWFIEKGKDRRSVDFPHGATFPEAGAGSVKQSWNALRSSVLPAASFSIDVLNLYTSVKQIDNLKYGRSQADFQKAYSSYHSVVATTSFTALMGLFARNASFASFIGSTLQLAGISEKAGYRRGDYEFSSLEDMSSERHKEFEKSKQRDMVMALGSGSISLAGAGVSYLRANSDSVLSEGIAKRMSFVQSAQMAKVGAATDLLALPIVNTVMSGYEIQRIASDKNQRFGYGNRTARNMAQNKADLLGITLFATAATLLARRPTSSAGKVLTKYIPGITTLGAALSKDAFVDRFQYKYTDRFRKAGIDNTYAQNLIARKAAKSTSDNYGLALGGSILLSAGLMFLTRGKGPSKQFLASLPALATSGMALANHEMTINSEIERRQANRANGGLTSEELAQYQAWQDNGTMYPDEWKDSDQYRNYALALKGQEARWSKWNANYYSSTGIRKGKGLGVQKLGNPWAVPQNVLRENAYLTQTQAIKEYKTDPVALGIALVGGGVVAGMVAKHLKYAASPKFRPPDILAQGESFFDKARRSNSVGQLAGNLVTAGLSIWRYISNNQDIRDKASQTMSSGIAGEIQAIRASADIVLKHDELVQESMLAQLPTGGNNWLGKSVRSLLSFVVGKGIFEGIVNPWTRSNEQKRVANVIKQAREQGINVDSALLQKALKAQANAQANPFFGNVAGLGQLLATGTKNPLALAESAAGSIMTSLGVSSAISSAVGKRRFENVLLNKSSKVSGAVLDKKNNNVRAASVSKEDEESFVDDYITNPYIYSDALPRIAGILVPAALNTWLIRKTWKWTANAIAKSAPQPPEVKGTTVGTVDVNAGRKLDHNNLPPLHPNPNLRSGQQIGSSFDSATPNSQTVLEEVINPKLITGSDNNAGSAEPAGGRALSTVPVEPIAVGSKPNGTGSVGVIERVIPTVRSSDTSGGKTLDTPTVEPIARVEPIVPAEPSVIGQRLSENSAAGIIDRVGVNTVEKKLKTPTMGAFKEVAAQMYASELGVAPKVLSLQSQQANRVTQLVSFTMEEVQGAQKLKRGSEHVSQALDKLAKLHAHGLTHGDIHGGNILVDKTGNVQFIDFAYSTSSLNSTVKRPDGNADHTMKLQRDLSTFLDAFSSNEEQRGQLQSDYNDFLARHTANPVANPIDLAASTIKVKKSGSVGLVNLVYDDTKLSLESPTAPKVNATATETITPPSAATPAPKVNVPATEVVVATLPVTQAPAAATPKLTNFELGSTSAIELTGRSLLSNLEINGDFIFLASSQVRNLAPERLQIIVAHLEQSISLTDNTEEKDFMRGQLHQVQGVLAEKQAAAAKVVVAEPQVPNVTEEVTLTSKPVGEVPQPKLGTVVEVPLEPTTLSNTEIPKSENVKSASTLAVKVVAATPTINKPLVIKSHPRVQAPLIDFSAIRNNASTIIKSVHGASTGFVDSIISKTQNISNSVLLKGGQKLQALKASTYKWISNTAKFSKYLFDDTIYRLRDYAGALPLIEDENGFVIDDLNRPINPFPRKTVPTSVSSSSPSPKINLLDIIRSTFNKSKITLHNTRVKIQNSKFWNAEYKGLDNLSIKTKPGTLRRYALQGLKYELSGKGLAEGNFTGLALLGNVFQGLEDYYIHKRSLPEMALNQLIGVGIGIGMGVVNSVFRQFAQSTNNVKAGGGIAGQSLLAAYGSYALSKSALRLGGLGYEHFILKRKRTKEEAVSYAQQVEGVSGTIGGSIGTAVAYGQLQQLKALRTPVVPISTAVINTTNFVPRPGGVVPILRPATGGLYPNGFVAVPKPTTSIPVIPSSASKGIIGNVFAKGKGLVDGAKGLISKVTPWVQKGANVISNLLALYTISEIGTGLYKGVTAKNSVDRDAGFRGAVRAGGKFIGARIGFSVASKAGATAAAPTANPALVVGSGLTAGIVGAQYGGEAGADVMERVYDNATGTGLGQYELVKPEIKAVVNKISSGVQSIGRGVAKGLDLLTFGSVRREAVELFKQVYGKEKLSVIEMKASTYSNYYIPQNLGVSAKRTEATLSKKQKVGSRTAVNVLSLKDKMPTIISKGSSAWVERPFETLNKIDKRQQNVNIHGVKAYYSFPTENDSKLLRTVQQVAADSRYSEIILDDNFGIPSKLVADILSKNNTLSKQKVVSEVAERLSETLLDVKTLAKNKPIRISYNTSIDKVKRENAQDIRSWVKKGLVDRLSVQLFKNNMTDFKKDFNREVKIAKELGLKDFDVLLSTRVGNKYLSDEELNRQKSYALEQNKKDKSLNITVSLFDPDKSAKADGILTDKESKDLAFKSTFLYRTLSKIPIIGDIFFPQAAKAGDIPYSLMNQRQRQEAVAKQVKQRSAGSQYNLQAIQGKEQKSVKQIKRPDTWWRSEEEEIPWWKKLLQAVGKGVESLGNFLTRAKDKTIELGNAASAWVQDGLGGMLNGPGLQPRWIALAAQLQTNPLFNPNTVQGRGATAVALGLGFIESAPGWNESNMFTGLGGGYWKNGKYLPNTMIGFMQIHTGVHAKEKWNTPEAYKQTIGGWVTGTTRTPSSGARFNLQGFVKDVQAGKVSSDPSSFYGALKRHGLTRYDWESLGDGGINRANAGQIQPLLDYIIKGGTLQTGSGTGSGQVINNTFGGASTKALNVGLNLPESSEFGNKVVSLPGQGRVTITEGFFDNDTAHSRKGAGIQAIYAENANLVVVHGAANYNIGLDYVVGGNNDVNSLTSGRVINVIHSTKGYGNKVEVETDLLYNYRGQQRRLYTHYAHLANTAVNKGQVIEQGKAVGKMGSTGGSTGAHVDNTFWFLDEKGRKVFVSPNIIFGKDSGKFVSTAASPQAASQSQQIISRTERKSTVVGGVKHYAYTNTTQRLTTIADSQVIGGKKQQLNSKAAQQVNKMLTDLKTQIGVDLWVLSGYRSVEYQQQLWNDKKRSGKTDAEIAKSLAIPGFSEHHTGDAFDISLQGQADLTAEQWASNPRLRKARTWLDKHQSKYGFETSFLPGNKENVVSEPWHLRYAAPDSEYARQVKANVNVSQQVINQVQGLQVAAPQIRKQMVSDLKASSFAPLLNLMFKGERGIESINAINRDKDRTSNYSSTFQQQFGKSASDTTLGEIRDRQKQRGTVITTLKNGQKVSRDEIGAVGFPQLIGATLNDAVYALGLPKSQKFNKSTQEQLFKYLVLIKRSNLGAYLLGQEGSTLKEARQDLAREMASVPLVYAEAPLAQLQSSRIKNIKDEWDAGTQRQAGQSLYHGISGNKARVSGAEADKAIEDSRKLIAKDPALKEFLQKQYQEQQRLLAQQSANPAVQQQQQAQSQRNISYITSSPVQNANVGLGSIVAKPSRGVVTNRNDPDSREFVTGSDIQIGGIRNGVPIWNPIQGLTQVRPNSFQGQGSGRSGRGWGNLTRYRINLGNNRVVEMLYGHGDKPFLNYMGKGGIAPFALLGYQGSTGRATGPHLTTSYKPVVGSKATVADARQVELMVQQALTSGKSWVQIKGKWQLVTVDQYKAMSPTASVATPHLQQGLQNLLNKPQQTSTPSATFNKPLTDFKTVKASYYGKGFHGKRTASGAIYNQNALTVAVPRDKRNKPIIPFGTILEVINPTNGKRVLVKVTDTGSFGDSKGGLGRGLDLSVAAAKALGTIQAGVANVQYRIVKPTTNTSPQQLKPTNPNVDTPKPKSKFNILDPKTWFKSELPNSNSVLSKLPSQNNIVTYKRVLPVPQNSKQHPQSIKEQIRPSVPGLLVATVASGVVIKSGISNDLVKLAEDAEAAINSAAASAVQLVTKAKEDKNNSTIAFEHPMSAAAVRPIYQKGQELRTTKRQVTATVDAQDNTVYVEQQVSVHAVQAQLANRDVKVPSNPQSEAAAQPRMMNTKAS